MSTTIQEVETAAEEIRDKIQHLYKEGLAPDFEDVAYLEERVEILEAVARARTINYKPKKPIVKAI